jgi:hypothetical protein
MLARQHAEHTGLSLPVARRLVTALSIVANKPMPEGRDYAHFEDVLTRERTPTLNTSILENCRKDKDKERSRSQGRYARYGYPVCDMPVPRRLGLLHQRGGRARISTNFRE